MLHSDTMWEFHKAWRLEAVPHRMEGRRLARRRLLQGAASPGPARG